MNADPERAVLAFRQGADVQHLRLGMPLAMERKGPAVVKPEPVVFQTHPNAAGAGSGQAGHDAAAQRGDGVKVMQLELDAVETHQTGRGAKPQVAVPRLGDGVDAADGQAVPPGPGLVVVLVEAGGRIEGERDVAPRAQEPKPGKQHAGQPPVPGCLRFQEK